MACQYSVWQVTKTIQGNSVSISNNLPIFTKNYFEVKIHIGAYIQIPCFFIIYFIWLYAEHHHPYGFGSGILCRANVHSIWYTGLFSAKYQTLYAQGCDRSITAVSYTHLGDGISRQITFDIAWTYIFNSRDSV